MLTVLIILSGTAIAMEQTIEATGMYLIGDGPDENVATAKERARVEAKRVAAEKAGVYVESFSKSQNSVLTKDEINVVSAQIMRVIRDEVLPQVTPDGHILYTCNLQVSVNTDNIDLKKIMEDRIAVEKNIELEKKIKELQEQNEQLKKKYKETTDNLTKDVISGEIKSNEKEFLTAVTELPVYTRNGWKVGIDVSSIKYNGESGIISFNTSENNIIRGNGCVEYLKIKISDNTYFSVDTIGYDNGQRFSFKAGKGSNWRRIEPDSREEKYQQVIYSYLGIKSNSVNRPPKWEYASTLNFSDSSQYYYLDTNNVEISRDTGTMKVFTKCYSTKYGDNYNDMIYDFTNKKILAFFTESDRYVDITERAMQYDWDLYNLGKRIFDSKD